jgi:hypothetical protein
VFPEVLVSLRIFEQNPTMTDVPREKHSPLMAIVCQFTGFHEGLQDLGIVY